MRLTALKPIRVTFSLVMFFALLYLFVDFTGKLSHKVVSAFLFFQFIPSAVQFFHFFTLVSSGFIFVIVLTLVFGRVYCSFLCPLGTLQDFAIRIPLLFRKKRRPVYRKPHHILHFSSLGATLVLLFSGSLILAGILDPYSLAGRFFSDLFRPLFYLSNNLLSLGLKHFNNYTFYPVEIKFISWPSVVISLVLFAGIVLTAFFRGRWYCNTLCPVGAILGLLSRVSLFRIVIRESDCTQCGLCARVCKAGCIDYKDKKVDFQRCVACYNCFRACKNNGFTYGFSRFEKPGKDAPDASRRNFIKVSAAGTVGLAGIALGANGAPAGENQATSFPVTPPGSASIWQFTDRCTSCHLCVSMCPTKVLQPSFLDYGLEGILQPKMNFAAAYCNFDCVVCTEICPTQAIRPLTMEEKHRTQIGVSKFIKNICVVVEKHTACGACSEHCPTKAVEMVPYQENLKIPKVDEKICIGCGACEHACPTRPVRAIFVEANRYHRMAQKPLKKVETPANVKKVEGDFPF